MRRLAYQASAQGAVPVVLTLRWIWLIATIAKVEKMEPKIKPTGELTRMDRRRPFLF